ncbi:hypothetical protein T492DRAFT_943103 [Pavlovales sp. CCMP2436]|nr:hypothetical protein T492DRAFT_943103 [Pavlovales sp. CCMP2436]
MCDPCLDSIRQGLIYLSDPPVTKGAPHPTITDTAAKSACSPKCLPKYKVIADQFTKAAPEALKQYKALEAACLKDALPAIGAAVTGEMKALFATLESVRDLASGGMYMRAEASSADAPRSFATSKVLRVAAFGCLALGTVLLAVAAFVARRPESELRVESELL